MPSPTLSNNCLLKNQIETRTRAEGSKSQRLAVLSLGKACASCTSMTRSTRVPSCVSSVSGVARTSSPCQGFAAECACDEDDCLISLSISPATAPGKGGRNALFSSPGAVAGGRNPLCSSPFSSALKGGGQAFLACRPGSQADR
jgi:hypothetical protein